MHGLNAGDVLVVRLHLPNYLSYSYHGLPPSDAYDYALSDLVSRATSKGAKVLIIGANPTLTLEQERNVMPQWFTVSGDTSESIILPTSNPATTYYHLLDSHLQSVFAPVFGTVFFSLQPYLCDSSNNCKIRDGRMLLYRDSSHLTPYAHDLFFQKLMMRVGGLVR